MTERNVQFHRVEDYELRENGGANVRSLVCSFETQRFGYLQIGYTDDGLFEIPSEPDLNMFRQADKRFIESAVAIAWRMVFDVSAMKGRFR